jgi:transcriptional regulator with XRE-family HTH domain
MNECRKELGSRIAGLRKKKGLSQQALADLCGLNRQNLARIEAGKHSTGIDILSRIAEALGVKVGFIEPPP